MQNAKRVIHLARKRALTEFPVLMLNAMTETEASLGRAMALAASQAEQRTINEARVFVHQSGAQFRQRIEVFFADYLNRAMMTMYTDLRKGMQSISADTMSLIDDETMTRQIDVDTRPRSVKIRSARIFWPVPCTMPCRKWSTAKS